MMEENRKHKRRYADAFLGVFDRTTQHFVGHLIDMTVAGLLMECPNELETKAVYQFAMDLPVEIQGSNEIRFDARSVWCKPTGDKGHYRVGFEIQDLLAHEYERIELMLEGSLFSDVAGMMHVSLSKVTSSS